MGIWQYTLIGFAGFKNDLITIGGEVSYKSNLDLTEGDNAWGISETGSVGISEKTEIFVRYDYSLTSIPQGETIQWNYLLDGKFAIAGVQYTLSQNVKIALDYQNRSPYNINQQNTRSVYVNALFKF